MKDIDIEQKQRKAQIYANQTERFKVVLLELQMESMHGIRQIKYDDGKWHCTCDFFRKRGTCSHIMAAGHILEALPLTQPQGNE